MNTTKDDVKFDHENLTGVFPVSGDHLERLTARLAGAADAEGLLDVALRTVETPVGRLLLAATPIGLVRVAYEREGLDDVVAALAERVSVRVLEAPARLDDAARQFEEYFAGRRHRFDLVLDHRLSVGFRDQVQRFLPTIAYGQTMSYKQVAEQVGRPTAVRAVGTACATNPLPVVVPCHRVTRSDGSMGGYVGGLEAKAALLELERAA
ncbi:methylated-DNA--[protein]-cysteine S-methyltransferase [Aestuariimicrobium soli]|uniref:methylated-DNA--[protein]-cysteine S-methyltransferase n=1 Tax=Aestuariimicrobium soli TaxID=2035834 RepID=UPI003EBE29E6